MVQLRPIFPEDREAMLDILTSQQIAQTYMLPDFAAREDAIPLFRRLMALSMDTNRYLRGISLNAALIGMIHDVGILDRSIELGYVIHPDYQRNGYMTQAMNASLRELFDLGYQSVTAGAFAENAASIRVMEKAGMHPLEKTDEIPYRGKTHKCVYYSIEKQE